MNVHIALLETQHKLEIQMKEEKLQTQISILEDKCLSLNNSKLSIEKQTKNATVQTNLSSALIIQSDLIVN